MSEPGREPTSNQTDPRSLAFLLAGNVLLAAGLFVHAFLYNFYLRELQLPASVMGHQVAAMTLGGLVALLPAGMGVDRRGIRPALFVGVAAATAGLVLTAVARTPWLIYPSAFVIGLGVSTCRVAWGPSIMRLASAGARARVFTWNTALLIGGGALWTYLSGVAPRWNATLSVSSALSGIQVVLLGSAVITACSALCYGAIRLVPASGHAQARVRSPAPPRGVRLLIPLVALWMLAAALVLPFFNVFFADRFALPVERVGAMFASVQIATAMALVGAAELARRFGPRRMLMVWMAVFPPALLGLAAADALPLAVLLYLIQGLIAPATNPLIDQLLLERAPVDRQGVVASWRNAATEGSGALGASAGGRLLDAASFPALFLIAGVVGAVAAALLSAALRARRSAAALRGAEA